jgi:hypothetical protein
MLCNSIENWQQRSATVLAFQRIVIKILMHFVITFCDLVQKEMESRTQKNVSEGNFITIDAGRVMFMGELWMSGGGNEQFGSWFRSKC